MNMHILQPPIQQESLHWSNQKISSSVQSWVQICHDQLCLQLQCHPNTPNQKQICKQTTPGIQTLLHQAMPALHQKCTDWIMKHELRLKNSLQPKMQLFSISCLIIAEQMQQSRPYKHGKIPLQQDLQASPNHFQLHASASFLIKWTLLETKIEPIQQNLHTKHSMAPSTSNQCLWHHQKWSVCCT